VQRLGAEVGELGAAVAAEEEAVRGILGDPLPDDPSSVIRERLAELQRLDRAERDAVRATAEASQALLKAGQERERVASLIERQRDKLAVDHRPLLDRAARATGMDESPVRLSPAPSADDPRALRHFARRLADQMVTLADGVAREIEERSSLEGRLFQEGLEMVAGLVEPVPTLEALARAVDSACRAATGDVATTAHLAEGLAHRLERKEKLAQEARELEARARLFRVLAMELRADRLVAFLQAEALHVLAVAGSARLANLSDGRYRLVCRDDEFSVVDTWNGDEERSARTLSGGETFLASLALALALSEHVRSLSVTDRARLDSLFLDEGFGTLDPESLRVVVDAIEQLGGNGRLVGVITHVRELAEQFPRLEVEKSPRGSRVTLVP
jgi:exonuclease SbcC